MSAIIHKCQSLESCTCAAVQEPHLGVVISEDLQSVGFENPLIHKGQLCEKDKIAKIESSFKTIMETMGLDLKDPSITKTPHRVAKMYVKELCAGLVPENFPACTTFPVAQNSVVFQKDIPFTSMCEHHFLLFTGVAHVGYYSNGKVIGLSKLNRIVEYFARRPQIQERLNKQILRCL